MFQPVASVDDVIVHELMTGLLPHYRDADAGLAQQCREPFGFGNRYKRIDSTVRDQDRRGPGRRERVGHERHHRAKQDGAVKHARLEQDEAAGDIGAVRKTDADHASAIEPVVLAGFRDEVCELCRPLLQIIDIEDPF